MNARVRRPGAFRAFIVVLAAVLLLGVPLADPGVVEGASLKDQIAAARKRQGDLSKSINRQESLLRSLAADQASTKNALLSTGRQLDGIAVDQKKVKSRIARTEAALDRIEARHDALINDLRQSDFTLGLLEQELGSGEEDLKARREALGQRLAEAYRAESTSLLEQVVTAESFSDVLSQASAYLAYGEQDAQLAEEITNDQQALDTLRLLTISTRLRTDKLRRDTVKTQDEISARRLDLNRQKRKLARLEKKTRQIQDRQRAQYRTIIRNKRDARVERAKLRRAQAAVKAAIRSKIASFGRRARSLGGDPKGGFDWPTKGRITGHYGCSSFRVYPIRNGCPWHDGIDIAGPYGTRINAAKDGIVAYAATRSDGAYVVVLVHADGFETVYGHMQRRAVVRVGQFLRKGQQLGYMGSTGFSTGTHLHWEVSRNLVTVNPVLYL